MISNDQIIKDFKVFELDQRANIYLQEITKSYSTVVHGESEYPQFLLQKILQKIDLGNGKIITCLPKESKENDIYNFSHAQINIEKTGSLLSQGFVVEVESTRVWLINIFKEYLESTNNSAIIFAHIYSLPTDPYFQKTNVQILTTENEVYYFLTKEDTTFDRIREIILSSDGASPPLVAFCATLPANLKRGGRLSPEVISEIADDTTSVVISAYDGDGYLVWRRV